MGGKSKMRVPLLLIVLLLILTMVKGRRVAMFAEKHKKMDKLDGFEEEGSLSGSDGDNHHYYSIPDFNRHGNNDQGDKSPGKG